MLPAKETDTNGKTIRQLLALHTEDANVRPLPPAVRSGRPGDGRLRPDRPDAHKDLAGRPVDNVVSLAVRQGGPRRARVLRNIWQPTARRSSRKTLCHKFLGYALGRSLQLSDQALLEQMQAELDTNDYRFPALFELVATSPQFRNQRAQGLTSTRLGSRPIPTGD